MNIKFKSIKKKYFIFLAVCMVIIGAGIMVYLLIAVEQLPNDNLLKSMLTERFNGRKALLGLLIGIVIIIPLMKLIVKILTKEYDIELKNDLLEIKSKKYDKQFYYKNIDNIIIWNNTDYAKIVIEANDEKIQYNIGFANLSFKNKSNDKIIKTFDEIDKILHENKFVKTIENKKGIEIIKYKNKEK